MPLNLASFLCCRLPITTHKEGRPRSRQRRKLSQQLIEKIILRFKNELLEPFTMAQFSQSTARVGFSTDSFVVSPIFFPGGDIGTLAVHGTVNDLAMCGARRSTSRLRSSSKKVRLSNTSGELFNRCKLPPKPPVSIMVTGDTKVVDRGKGDQIFINTSGIGAIPDGVNIAPGHARPGDKIIINGPMAQHGMAIMSMREGLEFESEIVSDTAPLNGLVETMLAANNSRHARPNARRCHERAE